MYTGSLKQNGYFIKKYLKIHTDNWDYNNNCN